MKTYIDNLLNNYKAPLINSIIFSNGDLLVLENSVCDDVCEVRILCKSTIESYFEYNDDDEVSDYDILAKSENEKYKVFSGEGSYGSEGFVYVINKISNELLWFLFLDNSNPFDKVHIYEDNIVAVSTSGKEWRISILHPNEISIL
jgi:hypothetical protein